MRQALGAAMGLPWAGVYTEIPARLLRAIWDCAPRALIMAELAFVARRVKGEETREDSLQTWNLSLQREVCIPREAEALGLDLGMEMDSSSSSTCYRSLKAEIFLSCA